MNFSTPPALLLLVLLPAVAWLGWPARGMGRGREILSLALRLIITLCLVLALAGFSLSRPSHDLAVIFLIDVSDSMPEAAVKAAADTTRQAIAAMGPDDQAAIIVFGGDALVERPMSAGQERDALDLRSAPSTNATDLAEALRLALALYPPGAARRLVILSDGADTASQGNPSALLDTARLAQASGVDIVILPYVASQGAEVLVTSLDAPEALRLGERFDLRLTLQASRPSQVEIRVLEGDRIVWQGSQAVERGSQTYSLPLEAGQAGFTRYRVQIAASEDGFYQNNEMQAFSQVEGPPKVLLVAPPEGEPLGLNAGIRPDESSALLAALRAAGYVVETAHPDGLPSALAELAGYASLVLVDVPARDLSQRQMEAIQSYVRDLGGGLVAVGGPTSFGVGGYFRTPLEQTLPVEMQIKDEQRRPSLTMVFIIDHSGSMSDTSGGAAKLDLAKEAAMRSVELLTPMDRVGVIAFDETASWVVPITGLDNPAEVINAIGTIRSGGGTDILAGVQAMANALPQDASRVKHVLLLTDGGADPTGIPQLVSRLNQENGITLSTVGVGQDAAPFLKDLAALGGGRYHFTADPASIPNIFTEETTLATRAYLIEEPFTPELASPSPILSGIDALPQLYGYVGTAPKEAAQTILVSGQGDPLLATWQYGLGKAVAFTSDATGRWAKAWISWEGFPIFWAQIVRSTISPRTASPLEVSVEPHGEGARLVVDAYRPTEESSPYLNNYTMQARIVAPDGNTQEVDLLQTAPGRYEGDFTPAMQGAYLIRVSGAAPGGENVAETAGWVQAYSPEYRNLDSEPDTLARLAAASGGRFAPENPAEIFRHTLTAPRASRPAWPFLLALAAFLLPIDIAIRRLVIGRGDLARARQAIASRLLRRPSPAPALSGHTSRMDALLQARDRTRQPHTAPAARKDLMAQPDPQAILPPRPDRSPSEISPIQPPAPQASGQDQDEARPSRPSTASTLLEYKRKLRDRRDPNQPEAEK